MCSIALFVFGTLCSDTALSDPAPCFLFFLFLTLPTFQRGKRLSAPQEYQRRGATWGIDDVTMLSWPSCFESVWIIIVQMSKYQYTYIQDFVLDSWKYDKVSNLNMSFSCAPNPLNNFLFGMIYSEVIHFFCLVAKNNKFSDFLYVVRPTSPPTFNEGWCAVKCSTLCIQKLGKQTDNVHWLHFNIWNSL